MDKNEEKIQLQEGIRPAPGAPSNYGQGTTIRQIDDEGRIIDVRSSGAPLDTYNVKTKAEYENPVRVGDYYYTPNRTLKAWENSPTDLLQRSKVAIGGTEKPANSTSWKNEGFATLGPVAAGLLFGGPVGAAVGALVGVPAGLAAHNAAAEKALKDWQEQNVKYDTAVEFYKDEDGTVKYQFDYNKMGTGGPRSGEAVKEAQNRETKAWLGDDGRLKIEVSPIFASTARFQEMVDYISENYGNLSKDTENLDEVLTEIRNGIDGEAKNYVTNMKLYADFAHRFPNATPETIVAAYTTEVAGYVDPKEMSKYQMSVLEGDKVVTKSAKDFFDSVLKMDKGKRNELTKKLHEIVYGGAEGYTDDQRAIAYGELQSMFVASANTEEYKDNKYQGMMDADPVVSFINNFAPLGLETADVLSFLSGGSYSKQEYLNQNDFAEFLGGIAGISAGMGLWKAGTSLAGAALKLLPGTSQLFQASLAGKGKEALGFILQAWKNDPSSVIKAWSADALFKILQVGVFDAALAGVQAGVSDKDFWSEFGQDFARDAALMAVFSYYDMIKYIKSVDDTLVPVYTDPKTGNMVKAEVPAGEAVPERVILAGTGEPVEETFTSIGYSGKPEEFMTTGNGTSVYTQTGSLNIRQTRLGETVGVYKDADKTILYYDGKSVSISNSEATASNLLPSGDIDLDEFPALNSGVVNASAPSDVDITEFVKTLENEGLVSSVDVSMVPSQQADAAVVAGKIAKLQGTKFGSKVYEQLFSKNALLDMANNLALAKDGDLNAWRNAQEQFVSVTQNAQDELHNIQNGVYVKEAAQEWQNTVDVIGGFNIEFKYKPKTDGAYINAINQVQRAQLLNNSRVEGDTTDYVAKALEKYGDVISKMPEDRAEALQGWLEQGKKWLKVFNQSVRKSGKIDVKLLDSYTDTDIEAEIGYFPVWAKKTTYKGLLDNFYGLSQERNPYKDWLRDGEWVPLDELEDPYTAMTRYMGFMTNNMGLNNRNETAAKVMERADLLVDNTPTEATIRKRKLESIKNKDELTKKLDEMVEAKKKEVKEATLTPKQYKDAMAKIYEDSAIEEVADALANLGDSPVSSLKESEEIEFAKERFAKALKAEEDFNKLNTLYLKTGNEKYQTMAGDELSKRNEYLVDAGVNPLLMRQDEDWTPKEFWQVQHENYLAKLRAKSGGEKEQWNDFWKNAPAQTRKDIRNELEKTSLQTGYGISDTRARLNTQVPGADVLDWSLLSREQVNGLVPGGFYAGKENPVKAYIMSVDDLVKLAGYDLDNAIPNMGKVIEANINTEGGVPVLPAHIRGSGDGPEVWLKMRWGHNSDGVANWTDYLKTLKERGIEKVPVAIDDARGSDFNSVFYQVRNSGIAQKGMDNMVAEIDRVIASGEKPNFDVRDISAALHLSGMSRDRLRKRIRKSIPSSAEEGVSYITNGELEDLLNEAAVYDWANDAELNSLADNIENVVKTKIGYVPQDITADVQQAFSEYGQIPFYHGQHAPLGSMEYNDPSGAREAYQGAGDAYWLAPNSSYTDDYGKNKLAGTIPIKYFMSDKEKKEIINTLSDKLSKFREKIKNKIQENVNKAFKTDVAPKEIVIPSTLEKWSSLQKQKGLFPILEYEPHFNGDYIDYGGNLYNRLWRTSPDGTHEDVLKPSGDVANPEQTVDLIAEGRLDEGMLNRFLTNKERKEIETISKNIVDYSGAVKSYRALAEYTGKPIIDISEDGFANGTAFFYFKGVDPKFDEEIGQQLAAQALFDRQHPQWTGDAIANAMENYDGMSLDEMIDNVTNGEGWGEDWETALDDFSEGEISSSELTEDFMERVGRIAKKNPGLAKVMQETWDNNAIQDLRDMKFRYWNPSTGYETIDDTTAAQFLEEMGEKAPGYSEEDTAEGQLNFYDATRATVENIPNQPEFKQPRIPTYEDYQKGLQADPSMVGRIQDSYRGALAQRLVKEASRVVGLAEDYLSAYSWGNDWQSYLNTSLIPDLKEAINQRMLPEEFRSFVQARMVQAIQDVAPYQSPEMVMKSQLENVAQEWRDWAEKHIKTGRFTQKDLKEFVESHNLELPNDKRPYPSKVKHALWQMLQDGKRLPKIEGLSRARVSKDMVKEDFYKLLDGTPLFQSAIKDKQELVDLVAAEKNGETTDGYTMGVSATALGLGSRYPWTWYKKGKPYTRFIKADTPEHRRWAEEFVSLANDKELVREEGLISRFLSGAANDFRLLTTGWDPSRVFPNITRDTTRSFSVGPRFINAKNTLQSAIEMGNYSPKQKQMLSDAIEDAAKNAANSSYNSAYRSPKSKQIEITKEYLSQSGASPMKRFMYNVVHDKRSIAEFPMEFFEGWSRKNNARSLAAVQLGKDQAAGLSFKEQLKNAVDAANFAGREYTANFQRKGKLIGRVSKYVAYQSSAYAGLDGMMRAFIDNPKLVARNFAVFVIAYLILLGDTLSREETRKQYYRLSEYDRKNQIVIGMGDSILTIPMDQELAGLLYPYRAIMETLEGTDQVSFFQFLWGTFTEWMPMDLSGFSEGDGFNLARGLEKFAAQNMPTGLTPILEAATGYDLYYGNDISVSKETLKDYGIYSPQPGDYTTTGKDSLLLRNVANITGIPQWQLQAMWEGYGGNIGKYVLNILDKTAGATKDQQGGKDFADTVFNSFTALDQDAASSAFYDGLGQLKKEKDALIQKIAGYNEDLKTASGSAKIELQNKIQQAKRDYGTKVGDFVDKYVSAYDITGGLPKKYAQQIYYLFRLDDDATLYESGSPEEYYNNQAKQKFENQATALAAPILDKYYNNRLGNIYQDANGVWRRYLSGGAQAMKNSIYGYGEQQMVDLLNILENKDSGLGAYRTQIKNARNAAYEAKDWDTRDALGYELDKKVIEAISPYIEHYGAENVLGNSQVLDYLSEWFIVPDDFIRTKKGKYVSLGNNASTQEAFVRPFIKYVFGLPTNFSSYRDAKYNSLEIGK